MTNAERIRIMSDDELANFLRVVGCNGRDCTDSCYWYEDCTAGGICGWLEAECMSEGETDVDDGKSV